MHSLARSPLLCLLFFFSLSACYHTCETSTDGCCVVFLINLAITLIGTKGSCDLKLMVIVAVLSTVNSDAMVGVLESSL